jgi:hypothetical protein
MTEQALTNLHRLSDNWVRTMSSMIWGQWVMLDTGLQTAQAMLEATTGAPRAQGAPTRTAPVEDLLQRATDRMALGLAPPREIYQLPYRARIDWSRFPEWARPIDPELFEGTGHEG